MNENNNLDSRLAGAVPSRNHSTSTKPVDSAHTRKIGRLRASWVTMSQSARRSSFAGVAAVAVALISVPLVVPAGQQPLFSLASSGQAGAESSKMSAEMSDMMMPWVSYNYVPSEELSRDRGRGAVYKFELSGDPAGRANELAAVFAVDGKASKSMYFDAAYPSYVVGSEDWTDKSIYVSWYGTGSWSYSNPAADVQQPCINPMGADPQTTECFEYAAPITNLNPSKDDAAQLASEMFGKTGLTVAASDIDVYRDEYVTVATAALVVGGDKVAVEWSATWTGSGELSSVVGHSGKFVSVGEYDTVSAYDAVTRLNDWRWSGMIPWDGQFWPMAYSRAVSSDGVTSSDSGDSSTDNTVTDATPEPDATMTEEPAVEPSETPDTDVEPTVEPTIDPEPLPIETPEVVTITVSDMTPRLVMVWDADGNAWLVPGFTTKGESQWTSAVVSLIEGIIRLPEPMPVEPAGVQY